MAYIIPVTVACSRYTQRAAQPRTFLVEAIDSLEHHAERADYAHHADEFRRFAAELRAMLGKHTITVSTVDDVLALDFSTPRDDEANADVTDALTRFIVREDVPREHKMVALRRLEVDVLGCTAPTDADLDEFLAIETENRAAGTGSFAG